MSLSNLPSSPISDLSLLHAYVDGELDPTNALAMEKRIADNPALAQECARIEALRATLRARLLQEAPSPDFRARIEKAIGARETRPATPWRSLAASILLSACLASGSTWLLMRGNQTSETANAVLSSHLRGLMAAQPTDVSSSESHTVKPWFNGRIPQAPRVIDLTSSGFPLVGGRVDVIGGAPVSTIVYRRRQHVISLVADPSGATSPVSSEQSLNGYNLINWNQGGVSYWAVSDLNGRELGQFADMLKQAP